MKDELLSIEEKEVAVRDARMALVATEIFQNVVIMYEFLPIEEARLKVKELRNNALL